MFESGTFFQRITRSTLNTLRSVGFSGRDPRWSRESENAVEVVTLQKSNTTSEALLFYVNCGVINREPAEAFPVPQTASTDVWNAHWRDRLKTADGSDRFVVETSEAVEAVVDELSMSLVKMAQKLSSL